MTTAAEIARKDRTPPPEKRKPFGYWKDAASAVAVYVERGWSVADACRRVMEITDYIEPEDYRHVRSAYYALQKATRND